MPFIRDNIKPRLRLLEIAFGRRFIWNDVIAMAKEYGLTYSDLRGDVEPIEFARGLLGLPGDKAAQEISQSIGSPESFMRPGAPEIFNSEPTVAHFLAQLVYYGRCRVVVELGCFVGWATAHMARSLAALGAGQLYAVDLSREYLDIMQENLRRHGFERYVTAVQGGSLDESTLRSIPDKADLIFIDTAHTYPFTLHEIRAYAPRLAPGGYLALHDSTSTPGVRRSIAEVSSMFRVLTFATEQSTGLTVLQAR